MTSPRNKERRTLFGKQVSYKSDKPIRWAIMQRFDIPDSTGSGAIYLRRWRIIQTPLASIYLHKIMRPDADKEMHDYPWNFTSIILRGGYREHTPDGFKQHHWGSAHRMKATDRHRIVHLYRHPTWTLCLVGKRRRDWGFYTTSGWVPWQQFLEVSTHKP